MAAVGGTVVRLWDWPVRIVHWGLAVLIPAMWWTGEYDHIEWHKWLGYSVLGLVVFRLIWGVIGSSTARFTSFVRGPRTVFAYLRGRGPPTVGHNPIGALSVVALLGIVLTQASLGLFAQDVDAMESGPLTYLVSYETADAAREWHHFGFNVILGLVALHLAAIAYYAVVKRNNLVTPMLTGRRRFAEAIIPPVFASAWRLLVAVPIALGLIWWVSLGAPL